MNIIIAGGTCSGKTTLANEINDLYSGVCIMPEDNYFKDLIDIPKHRGRYLMDSINAFEYSEYYQDTLSLIRNGQVQIPRYDINCNRRIAKDILLLKRNLIVLEGLHAIKILSDIPDSLKIFLLVDLKECLRRRIERDSKKYGVSSSVIEEHFNECIVPMYKDYIALQSKTADVIIREGEDTQWVLKKYIKS